MALKQQLLTAYWFEGADPDGAIGFGVTACSLADAELIIRRSGYATALLGQAHEVRDLDGLLGRLGRSQLIGLCAPIVFRGRWYPAWCWWVPVAEWP